MQPPFWADSAVVPHAGHDVASGATYFGCGDGELLSICLFSACGIGANIRKMASESSIVVVITTIVIFIQLARSCLASDGLFST